MTSPPRKTPSLPRIRITKTASDGDVGYGRPPKSSQFKSGQSGNPKGRPKGARNEATILHELLHRKIPIREGGRTRKIMVLEAILTRFAEDSLKGNTKSATFLLNRHGAAESGEPQRSDLNDDDQEILNAYAQRLLTQRNAK